MHHKFPKTAFTFLSKPAIGDTAHFGSEQPYELVRVDTSLNGASVFVWQSRCCVCAASFECTTGADGRGVIRTCELHRGGAKADPATLETLDPIAKTKAWLAKQREGPHKRANVRYFAKHGWLAYGDDMTQEQKADYRRILEEERAKEPNYRAKQSLESLE